ncbi:MAG TPA: hypothetical protein VGL33_26930, partial [Streptosporangiaceae bacterium]
MSGSGRSGAVAMPASLASVDGDPLIQSSPPGVLWTRGNSAEAAPGVLTAMNCSFYGQLSEVNVRRALYGLGVIPRSATGFFPDAGDRFTGIFHGRLAMNVDVFRILFSGLPGVTGDQVERDILGSAREGITDRGYPGRVPAVLLKAPVSLAFNNRRALRFRGGVGDWWSARVGPDGPRADPRVLLDEAVERWRTAMWFQGRNRLIYQGASSRLTELAGRAGDPTLAGVLLAGAGDLEEAEVADDLWAVARASLGIEEFVRCYGFHGPSSAAGGAHNGARAAEHEDLLPAHHGRRPGRRTRDGPAVRRRRPDERAGRPVLPVRGGGARSAGPRPAGTGRAAPEPAPEPSRRHHP